MTSSDLLRAGTWPSRILAVVLLIAAVAGVSGLIVTPIAKVISDADKKIGSDIQLLARLKAIVAFSEVPSAKIQAVDAQQYRAEFLAGDQEAVVVADLQSRLRTLIVSHNSELMSAAPLPQRASGGLAVLGLKLQIRGQLADIQKIVHAMESGTPLLWVGRAQLGLEQRRMPGTPVGASLGRNIMAELDVFGAQWSNSPVDGKTP